MLFIYLFLPLKAFRVFCFCLLELFRFSVTLKVEIISCDFCALTIFSRAKSGFLSVCRCFGPTITAACYHGHIENVMNIKQCGVSGHACVFDAFSRRHWLDWRWQGRLAAGHCSQFGRVRSGVQGDRYHRWRTGHQQVGLLSSLMCNRQTDLGEMTLTCCFVNLSAAHL